jgi:thiol:disulfide interchange protein/DsbC/DsbD-like thiol-disulfide interchange protein
MRPYAMSRPWNALLGAIAMLVWVASPGAALESDAHVSPRASVTLISDVDSVAPGQSFRVGLLQKLAPHWHSYWKNPGDAGVAPTLSLTVPEGARASAIAWPGPDRIDAGPVRNFGYENEIVLPVTVTVPATIAPGSTFSIAADADWLVCEKQCIPEAASFRLELPVSTSARPADGDVAAAFAAADARAPERRGWTVRLTNEGGALALTVEGDGISAETIKSAFFYPAEWGVVVHAAAQQLEVEDGRLRLAMEKGASFDALGDVSGLLAISDGAGGRHWIEIAPSVAPPGPGVGDAPPGAKQSEGLPWAQAALFAFLGGLILNLMPCVFPVLAIKAASVAALSGGALRETRLASVFYTLGVLAAFLSLAGVLLVARAGGAAVGWGFQFQSPVFVAAMSWLFLAIGLNLSGVYEIGLGTTGAGQGLAQRRGHAGGFFTGLLAVVAATPCTAPFMGAAVGAALSAPPLVCLALFAALGLGLAAPYALLALFPRLARLLPRPGAWMLRLRQAMAFPMYASAAWLVWVLAQQAGDFGVLIALSGALLVGFGAWTYGVVAQSAARATLPRGLAAASVLGLAALLPQLGAATAPRAIAAVAGPEPFSAARLAALRAEGKPVFVNMTAAWCITCLVNERTTLSASAVKDSFRAHGVAYLEGDWTNQNPEITAFLRGFSRDGVPFYVFYPPGGKDAVLLPSVLTVSAVVEELDRVVAN